MRNQGKRGKRGKRGAGLVPFWCSFGAGFGLCSAAGGIACGIACGKWWCRLLVPF